MGRVNRHPVKFVQLAKEADIAVKDTLPFRPINCKHWPSSQKSFFDEAINRSDYFFPVPNVSNNVSVYR